MEWTCTDCGSSVVADDAQLPTSMGWKIVSTAPGQAVCAPCVRKRRERHVWMVPPLPVRRPLGVR